MTNDDRAAVRAVEARARAFRFRDAEHLMMFVTGLAADLAKIADEGTREPEKVKVPTGQTLPGVRIIGRNQVVVAVAGRRPPKPANDDVHAAARAAFKVV